MVGWGDCVYYVLAGRDGGEEEVGSVFSLCVCCIAKLWERVLWFLIVGGVGNVELGWVIVYFCMSWRNAGLDILELMYVSRVQGIRRTDAYQGDA